MQQMGLTPGQATLVPGQVPTVVSRATVGIGVLLGDNHIRNGVITKERTYIHT